VAERVGRAWQWLWRREPPRTMHETWRCPVCDRAVEVPSGGPMITRKAGMYLPPDPRQIRKLCEEQNGVRHTRERRS